MAGLRPCSSSAPRCFVRHVCGEASCSMSWQQLRERAAIALLLRLRRRPPPSQALPGGPFPSEHQDYQAAQVKQALALTYYMLSAMRSSLRRLRRARETSQPPLTSGRCQSNHGSVKAATPSACRVRIEWKRNGTTVSIAEVATSHSLCLGAQPVPRQAVTAVFSAGLGP